MKITSLEPQRHNPERVNVSLDGSFAFGLAAIEAARLRVGQELSEADVARLREADAYHRAHDRALAYLAPRPRSTEEVRRYLSGKEISEPLIEAVIERLSDVGLLDDETFGRFWVDNRERFRPRGQRALRYELRQKGLDRSTVDAVLEDAELDEGESAYRAAKQKLGRFQSIEDQQQFRQKVGSYLARRGFRWEASRDAVERLWQFCEADRRGETFDDGTDEDEAW